jgi:uncharacterized phage protein gp47/JayE
MPFTPEYPDEIRRRMLTRLIATSRLIDLSEGSEFGSILGVVSDEMSSVQFKLSDFHQSHLFNARGQLLDDRIAQLPTGFERRREPRPARGGNVTLWRSTSGTTVSYGPGELSFSREDAPDLRYVNTDTITFDAASLTATGISVRSVAVGTLTNAPPGAINVLLSAPSDVYQVRNLVGVGGGSERESDDELRGRAELWLNALTRTTNTAIEALAVNYIPTSTDQRVRYARVWEDPDTRGYCELLIDDGFGFIGSTRAANTQSGVVPDIDSTSARHQFTFESPAATAPNLTVSGVTYTAPTSDFLVVEERGVMLAKPNSTSLPLAAGDEWSTGGHQVYTGLPAELQAYVEANCRAAGSRVRVVVPTVTSLKLSANVTVYPGYDISDVFDTVKRATSEYVSRVLPGSPLLIFRLCGELINIPGVRNIKFDQTDRYPATPRTKFVCYYNDITLR